MFTRMPDTLRRSLERLRRSRVSVGVDELAREILALDAPIDRALARRIVAAALGRAEASLPDRIDARHVRPAEEAVVADVPLSEAEFVVVDLETTGLSTRDCSILEVGAVRIRKLGCVDSFETLVRPGKPVPSRIADLTGIDDAARGDKIATVRAGDKEFKVKVRIDTPKEIDYCRHGGILKFVLRQLAAK